MSRPDTVVPRKRRDLVPRWLALGAVVVLGAAACTSGASPTPAPTASPSAPPAATDTPAPTERVGPPEGQESSFTVGVTSIGTSTLPLLAAVDALNEDGYDIEWAEIAESELVVEGVAQGRFAFGAAANNAVMAAMEQGAKIKFLVDRTLNEWQVYAVNAVTKCTDLEGSRVAIHSPGSVSGAMLKDWIKNECPEINYDPLIIEGSQNRLAAMLADQIDVTPMELADTIKLDTERPGDFHLLVNFSTDLPDLHLTSVYSNQDFIDANPDVVYDMVKAVVEQHRMILQEDGYLLSLIQKYLPEEAADAELAKTVADAYIERKFFPLNGGLTKEAVEYTLGFFGPEGTGSTSRLLTFDETTDLSFLEQVLDDIGRL